jgi:hypothetical protein
MVFHMPETTSSSQTKNDLSHRTKWLVVGDGDLSYSASIASEVSQQGIHLTATVWEDQDRHQQVYERSTENVKAILLSTSMHTGDYPVSEQHHHPTVLFGIDATQLHLIFPTTKFHRIIFNFPHWRGKTNAKRNRQLVRDFFQSASQVLEKKGEICIALCQGQGGFPSRSLTEWRQSWLVVAYAAEHGLLLHKLESYQLQYTPSSYRGVDRPWKKRGDNQLYTFRFPSNRYNNYTSFFVVDESLQLSCRHELRVMLHPDKLRNCPVSRSDILNGDAVYELARKRHVMPEGIELQIAARYFFTPDDQENEDYHHHQQQQQQRHHYVPLAVFLMNYSGISQPITRQLADDIRAQLELAVQEIWHLDVAQAGRLVSRPYPRHLLPTLIKKYNCSKVATKLN